jgi:hypothetical protein
LTWLLRHGLHSEKPDDKAVAYFFPKVGNLDMGTPRTDGLIAVNSLVAWLAQPQFSQTHFFDTTALYTICYTDVKRRFRLVELKGDPKDPNGLYFGATQGHSGKVVQPAKLGWRLLEIHEFKMLRTFSQNSSRTGLSPNILFRFLNLASSALKALVLVMTYILLLIPGGTAEQEQIGN